MVIDMLGRSLRFGVFGLFGMALMGFGYRLYPSYATDR
jgi:hypothetical protein